MALGAPPPAHAGVPGTWERLTDPQGLVEEPGEVRTDDGVLHVVWAHKNEKDLVHTPISATGALGSPTTIDTFSGLLRSPDISRTAGGLRVFASGVRGSESGMYTKTGSLSGTTWDSAVRVSTVNGTAGTPFSWSGTPIVAIGSSTVFVHSGLDPSTPDYQYGSVSSWPDLALAGGKLWVAWGDFAVGTAGAWVQEVDQASGAPVGQATRMPRTDGDSQSFRTPITGHAGTAYIAYSGGSATPTDVLIWPVGASDSTVLAHGVKTPGVTLSSDANGIWVVWSDASNNCIYGRRSNADATVWGATVSVPAPSQGTLGTRFVHAASNGSTVDVLAQFDTANDHAIWHSQLTTGTGLRCASGGGGGGGGGTGGGGRGGGADHPTATLGDLKVSLTLTPRTCVPFGGHLTVKANLKRRRGSRRQRTRRQRVRVKKIAFTLDRKQKKTDRRKPFRVTYRINFARGTTHTVRAKIYYRRGKSKRLRKKTLSRSFTVCAT
jgi:hypothetical protein